jgi:hypothetical protein
VAVGQKTQNYATLEQAQLKFAAHVIVIMNVSTTNLLHTLKKQVTILAKKFHKIVPTIQHVDQEYNHG